MDRTCDCCGPSVVIEAGKYLENDGAKRARRWAQSRESPNGKPDEESPTGLTMSSRSWAIEARKAAGSTDIVSEEFIAHLFD